MCGFYTEISFKSARDLDNGSLKLLNKRGPDSQNLEEIKINNTEFNLTFYHARLAISGLGEVGTQPIKSYSDRWIISFNGEIYNYRDLASKFLDTKRFPDTMVSDARCLVELIDAIGIEKTVELIDGPLALTAFDFLNNKFFIFRDFFGEKPLYFRFNKSSVQASSILDCLLVKNDQIDTEMIILSSIFGFVPAPLTIYKSINKCLPGSLMAFEISNDSVNFIDSLAVNPNQVDNSNYQSVEEILFDSLDKRISTIDSTWCLAYSGGVDSTLVKLMSKDLGYEFKSYMLIDNQNHESNEKDVNFTLFSKDLFEEIYTDIRNSMSEPISDPAIFMLSALCKSVAGKHKVMLTGDGADEIFIGYPRQRLYQLSQVFHFPSRFVDNLYLKARNRPKVSEKLLNQIVPFVKRSKISSNPVLFNQSLSFVDKLVTENLGLSNYDEQLEVKLNLSDYLLTKADLASMTFGVELRSPFLNKSLLNYKSKYLKSERLLLENKPELRSILKQKYNTKVSPVKRGFGSDYIVDYLKNELTVSNSNSLEFISDIYKTKMINVNDLNSFDLTFLSTLSKFI